jgi:hypothetical protein
MSPRVAELLYEQANLKFDKCMTRVCAAFNDCKIADRMCNASLMFLNDSINVINNKRVTINFKVLELPYDLIIGRRDIWVHNLNRYLPYPYNLPNSIDLEKTSSTDTDRPTINTINHNESSRPRTVAQAGVLVHPLEIVKVSTSANPVMGTDRKTATSVHPNTTDKYGSATTKHRIPFRTVEIRGTNVNLLDTDQFENTSDSKKRYGCDGLNSRLDSHKRSRKNNLGDKAKPAESRISNSTLTSQQRKRTSCLDAPVGNSEAEWLAAFAEADIYNAANPVVPPNSHKGGGKAPIGLEKRRAIQAFRINASLQKRFNQDQHSRRHAPRRKVTINKLRQRGQHASSTLSKEPKAGTEGNESNQKFPKQLWQASTVEEFHMIRSSVINPE